MTVVVRVDREGDIVRSAHLESQRRRIRWWIRHLVIGHGYAAAEADTNHAVAARRALLRAKPPPGVEHLAQLAKRRRAGNRKRSADEHEVVRRVFERREKQRVDGSRCAHRGTYRLGPVALATRHARRLR